MVGAGEAPRFDVANPRESGPLLDFMVRALEGAGCVILQRAPSDRAPLRLGFEAPWGERIGVVAYASAMTAERRLCWRRGLSKGEELWQDPFGLCVTLLVGIDLALGVFVGSDPALYDPARGPTSAGGTPRHVAEILKNGWHAWEARRRGGPIEVLVGGTAESFLRYVLFEREALGEDQGHRHLLAEKRMPALAHEWVNSHTPLGDCLAGFIKP